MNAGTLLFGWLTLTAAVVSSSLAAESPEITGAEVDESRVVKTYYVDAAHPEAADRKGRGTRQAPFKTISHACEAAAHDQDAGTAVKILVADGVYRESVTIPAPKDAEMDAGVPLIIEAANRQQAFIDGADVAGWEAATWKREGLNWSHPWPFRKHLLPEPPRLAGTPKNPSEVVRRGELLFFNGAGMRQVLAPIDLAPGTFCVLAPPGTSGSKKGVALTPPDAGMVILQPPDSDAENPLIEISVRGHGLAVQGRRNVVIRGLAVQHAGNLASGDAGEGIALKDCSNALIEDVISQCNNAAGLTVSGRTAAPWSAGITLRRVQLLYNGGAGLTAWRLKNLLVEDCETSFNGFRDDWSGWIDGAAPGGCKVSGIHGSAWRRHRAVGNWRRGMWWDSDNANLTIEDSIIRNNCVSGLFIENNPGPAVVRRCIITGTKTAPAVRDEAACPAALSISTTPDVTLEGNIVANNDVPQFGLWDIAQRADGANFETRVKSTRRAERHVYRHNVFCGLNAGQVICNLPLTDRAGRPPFDFYYATLVSDENCFWNPMRSNVFCHYDRTNYQRLGIDFAGWRAFLASRARGGKPPERASLWQDPLFVEPMEGDFRLQPGSPAAEWDLASDERAAGQ
jgi:hypothetical protein